MLALFPSLIFSGIDLLPSRISEWGWSQSWLVRSLSSTQKIRSRSILLSCFNLAFPSVLLRRRLPVQDLCPEWSVLLVFEACVLISSELFTVGGIASCWFGFYGLFDLFHLRSLRSSCNLLFNFWVLLICFLGCISLMFAFKSSLRLSVPSRFPFVGIGLQGLLLLSAGFVSIGFMESPVSLSTSVSMESSI